MRILTAALLAAVAQLGSIAMTQAVARADTNTFLDDLYNAGFYAREGGSNADLISTGTWVCDELKHGDSRNDTQNFLYDTSSLPSLYSAQTFVEISVNDLCQGV